MRKSEEGESVASAYMRKSSRADNTEKKELEREKKWNGIAFRRMGGEMVK